MEVCLNEKKLDDLQKWFEDNKKLPPKIDRVLLLRFYHCMHKDVEETKKLLEQHYAIRESNPNLFINRDMEDEGTKNTAAYSEYFALPTLTPDNNRILILRLKSADPKLMHCIADIKCCIMVDDARFTFPDVMVGNTPQFAEGDIQIIDMGNFTVGHMTRFISSISAICKYIKYLEQAYPVRIKGMHIVKCPWFIGKIVALLKPFVKNEVYEMIRFHTTKLETLYEYIPKELLPTEYGGNAGKTSDISDNFLKPLYGKGEYFKDANYWRIDKQ